MDVLQFYHFIAAAAGERLVFFSFFSFVFTSRKHFHLFSEKEKLCFLLSFLSAIRYYYVAIEYTTPSYSYYYIYELPANVSSKPAAAAAAAAFFLLFLSFSSVIQSIDDLVCSFPSSSFSRNVGAAGTD